jgi:hypothetical protein
VTVQTTTSAIAGAGALNYPFLTVGSAAGLNQGRYLSGTAGISLTDNGAGNSLAINLTGTAASLNAASQGFIVKNSASTVTNVQLTVGAGMTIANANGTTGNPLIGLNTNLQNVASLSGIGLVIVNGSTFTQTTLGGTSNQIVVTNGNAGAGAPTFSLANNPILPGSASVTVPIGSTAQRSGGNGAFRYNSDTGLFEGYNGSWNAFAAGSGVTSIATGTGLTGGPITSTGTISIANTAVTAAAYGSASSVATFTVNAQGQLTLASNTSIAISASQVTSGTLAVAQGGTGVATLSGVVFGNGTSAFTAATGAQIATAIGTTAVTNSTNTTNLLGGANGSLPYQTGSGATTFLAVGTNGYVLTLAAGVPTWAASTGGVTSFSAGTTGLTPSSATTGTITLAGTLVVGNGGTGAATLTGYVYGNGTSAMTASTTIPNTAITGLGTMSTQNANAVAITGGAIDGTTVGSTTAAAGSFTTLNSSGNTRLGGLSGNQSLQVNNVVSAVNYIQATGNTTGNSPILSAQGSDANIGLTLTPKGTGVVTISSDAVINGMTVGIGGGSLAQNAAFGGATLPFNTTGNFNVAVGYQSMFWNKIGSSNVGLGFATLFLNTTANQNLAMGVSALTALTTSVATFGTLTGGSGYTNGTYTAVAMTPVSGATFVTYPTVTVVVSGGSVTSVTLVTAGQGASSTATTSLTVAAALIGGTGSGFSILVGSFASGGNNTAIGFQAGSALATGSNNTLIGYQAAASSTTVSNEITLGNGSVTAFRIPGLSISAAASSLTIGTQFAVTSTASAVNYAQVTGAATGAAPTISAQGSDTNISLTLTPKGTGVVSTTSLTLSNTLTTAAYTETIVASGTVGASATLAITAGTVLTATLTSATACTFTMPTATAGKSFTLLLKQPAAGSATTATFTGVKWNSGGAPTITATLGRLDILAFVADGTNWYGTASQGYTYYCLPLTPYFKRRLLCLMLHHIWLWRAEVEGAARMVLL